MVFYRSSEIREEFDLEMPAERAFELVNNAYARVGKIKNSQKTFLRVDGKIGGGGGGLKLASVAVQVKKISDTSSKLIVDAAPKEGIINQGTVSSAITRLLQALDDK